MEPRRPIILTLLSIVAIVLGSLIIINGFLQLVTLAFQGSLNQLSMMTLDDPSIPEQLRESQQRMTEDIMEVQRAWAPFRWAMAPLAVIFGIVLILGGAWCLKLNPAGRRMLAFVAGFGIFFALTREVGQIVMSLQASQVMQEHMTAMSGEDERFAAIVSSAMGVSMATSTALYGAWLLLKLGFYVGTLVYLTRERTRQAFDGP